MNRVLSSLTLVAVALLAVSCGANRTPKGELIKVDSLVEKGIEKSVDIVDSTVISPSITAVFTGSDGKTRRAYQIRVVFYPDERATVSDDNNTYELKQYVTGSGYGYRDKELDLRGKGREATLTYTNGLVLQLTEKTEVK